MKQPNLIIALLAVLLSSATLQLKAQQQVGTEFTLGEFTYRILNNTTAWEVEVAGFNGTGNAYIPDYTENGYAVIGIGDYAFYNDLAPRTINIPQTVKYIGDYAFNLNDLCFSFSTGLIKLTGDFSNGALRCGKPERDNDRTPATAHKELNHVIPPI